MLSAKVTPSRCDYWGFSCFGFNNRGWLPAIYLYSAICRCKMRLHLPQQRQQMRLLIPCRAPPSCYQYWGGNVVNYTIILSKLKTVFFINCNFNRIKRLSVLPAQRALASVCYQHTDYKPSEYTNGLNNYSLAYSDGIIK